MNDVPTPGQPAAPKRKRASKSPASTSQSKSAAQPKAKAAPKAKVPPKTTKSKPATPAPLPASAPVDADRRWKLIAETAYRRAEQRGFEHGDPINDWLEAEREVDERLKSA